MHSHPHEHEESRSDSNGHTAKRKSGWLVNIPQYVREIISEHTKVRLLLILNFSNFNVSLSFQTYKRGLGGVRPGGLFILLGQNHQ